MKYWVVLLISMLLAACASKPTAYRTDDLFNDAAFRPPSEQISASDVFALSPEMKRYLMTEIDDQIRAKGQQRGLFDALYNRDLRIEYDSVMTQTAAQTFAAHSGNCLSLVIMTAAFAKALAIPVRYQSVLLDETWGRQDDVHFFIGHVNLTLNRKPVDIGFGTGRSDTLTIDFLPPQETRGMPTRVIDESTIIAMYLNNRAAERFTQGLIDDAYWWARASIVQEPRFVSSYNTLGIVYLRHGNFAEAEQVLSYALSRDPDNPKVMSNLVTVLSQLGRTGEAMALSQKLDRIEPNPPFSYFNRGTRAMREGDYAAARDLFIQEVNRMPSYHEFHFWLALAYVGLGDSVLAQKHLAIAIENSTSRSERELYAAKLGRINATRTQ